MAAIPVDNCIVSPEGWQASDAEIMPLTRCTLCTIRTPCTSLNACERVIAFEFRYRVTYKSTCNCVWVTSL